MRRGVQPHLANGAGEVTRAVCVHGETHLLAHFHPRDIRFGNRRLDLHLRQVAGDGEQGGGLERGGDGLPDINLAADDDARDRRANDRKSEIGAILADRCLRRGDLRGRRTGRGQRRLIILLADEILPPKLGGAARIGFGKCCLGLHIGEASFALRQPGAKQLRVQLQQHLALRHPIVEIDIEFFHRAGDLRPDIDHTHRVDRAVCSDHLGKRSTLGYAGNVAV